MLVIGKHKFKIYIYIFFCWFNFDALAQGNAYKPTKEPINYRGPGGDRTHDLQTEATPPAASCPARTLHATEIAPKKRNSNDMPVAALDNWQPVWNAQVSISTPVCVNFELRPGAGDIHFCWFNFDALAQGNAYKPTKEPINYRGPGASCSSCTVYKWSWRVTERQIYEQTDIQMRSEAQRTGGLLCPLSDEH